MSRLPAPLLDDICRRLDARIERPLGAGTFKEAFLIWRGDARHALKIAPLSPSLRERFDRESQVLRQCDHPCIAKLHENFIHDAGRGAFWVSVEEFLSGGTLQRRLTGGTTTPDDVRAIGIALLGALDHLRARSFVHRDIKPENILFRDEHTPVLTDFGIVRILGAPSLTSDFMMQGPGTPLYSAPEQLHNEKALIDWRTDQFGLALVLALAALGRHPFQPNGGTHREAIIAMAGRASLAPEVGTQLDAMKLGSLRRALMPWPVHRFPHPAAMIEALRSEG